MKRAALDRLLAQRAAKQPVALVTRLDGGEQAWQASFVGVDAWAPLAGVDAPRGSALFGLALESWWGRNGRLSLGIDQRVGGDDARQAALRYSTGF